MNRFPGLFMWPTGAGRAPESVWNELRLVLPEVVEDLSYQGKSVIQAGGNVGLVPVILSEFFHEVHTFEPSPRNFLCLEENLGRLGARHRVASYNLGLGRIRGRGHCVSHPDSCARDHLRFRSDSGGTDIVTLDSCLSTVALPLSLLWLDIEGLELAALQGAEEMISRHRPRIVIEDDGLSENYGIPKGEAIKWCQQLGYRVRKKVVYDTIMDPE